MAKLIIAVVSNDDSSKVIKALVKDNFFVTKLATTGGFLMSGNTTIMVGVQDFDKDRALKIIEVNSKKRTKLVPSSISTEFGFIQTTAPLEVTVGGATVFILNAEELIKL